MMEGIIKTKSKALYRDEGDAGDVNLRLKRVKSNFK